jgi:hypothetical protein
MSSAVHDLAHRTVAHNDVIQTVGGSNSIMGNPLEACRASTAELMNSAIQTGRRIEPLPNVPVHRHS